MNPWKDPGGSPGISGAIADLEKIHKKILNSPQANPAGSHKESLRETPKRSWSSSLKILTMPLYNPAGSIHNHEGWRMKVWIDSNNWIPTTQPSRTWRKKNWRASTDPEGSCKSWRIVNFKESCIFSMTVSLKRQRIVRNVGASQRASKYLNDPENPAGS